MGFGRLHHIGIATSSIEKSASFYLGFLGLRLISDRSELSERSLSVCLIDAASSQIELMEPSGPGPVANFLARHARGGMHHLCFEVPDLEAAIGRAVAEGAVVLDGPRIGAHGTPVVFLHPRSCDGVLIELMQARNPASGGIGREPLAIEPPIGGSSKAREPAGKTAGPRPLYTRDHAADLDPGLPGAAPFVRGIHASMYTGRPWTIRQYCGFSTADATNAAFRASLANGNRALSVAFDLPTHHGYDSDHPEAAPEVGKVGVAIDTVEDMKRLFEGIPLGSVSVSMTMSGAVLPVLAFFIVAAEEQGVAAHDLAGTIQNDIIKEFLVRNTYIYPPLPSLRIVSDVIAHCLSAMPRFNPISVSGYHMHEAGANAPQEIAFTIAAGLEYLRQAKLAGLDVDRVAQGMTFFFAVGMNFFTEIAKLRAARKLWCRATAELGCRDEKSRAMRMHCQTSGASLTEQDPLNNIVRTTLEGLAAALGGTQSLHTNAFDEARGLPTDASSRVARHTQLILQKEAGMTDVIDPLGGSYYVEALTEALCAEAGLLLDRVERGGGMARAVSDGWPRTLIENESVAHAAMIDSGKRRIVGVNLEKAASAAPERTHEVGGEQARTAQLAGLARVRAARDPQAVEDALGALRAAALGDDNLLERTIRCARVRATVGEVTAALEEIFGRHQACPRAARGIYGDMLSDDKRWTLLSDRVGSYVSRRGRPPRILLAKLGFDGHDRGINLVASVLQDLGFEVHRGALFAAPNEVAAMAADLDVEMVGVSTLAGGHLALVAALLAELRSTGRPDIRVIVGGIIPSADHPAMFDMGVGGIFGPGTNLLDAAAVILQLIGENLPSLVEA
jgi:methylmalonyl-CoA mutase